MRRLLGTRAVAVSVLLGIALTGVGGGQAVAAAATPVPVPVSVSVAPVAAAVPLAPVTRTAVSAPTAAAAPVRAQAAGFDWATVWSFLVGLFQQVWAWLFPPPPATLPLPYQGNADQVITVVAPWRGASTATVTAWNRTPTGWTQVYGPVPANIGPNGIGQASEYTNLTPEGAYPLTQAFGRQANPGTRLPYFTTGWWDWWDSNVNSPTYNTHVVQQNSPGGASENLFGAGAVYDYAVTIGYNAARVRGAGSAFFLHVSNGQPTAGCVAVHRDDLVNLLRWLDPGARPAIVIGSA
ncbi:L,D-transpeptidase family protein [Rhodococcus sp. X156]|uniref:L,D-transpeptidase family protein n=1 Tax=Rhodococcus sp. X156 TaxID=2499145 RepID=UPI000FD9B652|nr:L,D-transpeptidase family protein [Rhodococcus sp. X156]